MVPPHSEKDREIYNVSKLLPFALATGLAILSAPAAQAQEVTPGAVVSAMEDAFGVNPGQRRNHIKGVCAAGDFVGTAEAAALSRSPLFTGATLPVTARFSLPSGNPKLPDTTRGVRGSVRMTDTVPLTELLTTTQLSSGEMARLFGSRPTRSSKSLTFASANTLTRVTELLSGFTTQT